MRLKLKNPNWLQSTGWLAVLVLLSSSAALAVEHDTPSSDVPPAVSILGISAGGVRYGAAQDVHLPQRTTSVEIEYAGLSPTVPDRLRYRYRMEDLGEDWQEAGASREAIYTNLGPGRHRFHVIAAEENGVSNQTGGATLDFFIEPTIYQTVWFKVLDGVLIFILLWLMYLLRLRQMTLRLRMRLEERYSERERIARELHDTLLQGMQAVILRFHAIAGRVAEAETRQMIEQALDQADTVVEQGRDRVRALRDLSHPLQDLAESLAAFGRECAELHAASFQVQQQYRRRGLDPLVRDEICQIGREALFNAFRHAAARSIEVEVSYGGREFRLRVRDDGKGIAPEVLERGGREGHFGLAGMRERARRIRADLQIWSRAGLGTEVELRVPAATAYCGQATRSWLMKVLGRAVAEDVIP